MLSAGIVFALAILFLFLALRVKRTSTGKIEIKETDKGGYQLFVDGNPFLIKGVIYNPVPVGKGYNYNFFSSKDKPWLYDGKLMKNMGINCVRVYSTGDDLERVKEFINDMYEKFGIYTIVSDWLGLWSYPSANYADSGFRKKIREHVLKVVNTLKDEKGLLMWVLGNENNYTFSGKIGFWTSPEIEKVENLRDRILKKAEIYYAFVDSLAKDIKNVDSRQPVALGNGEASFLNIAAKTCNNIDVLAVIIYRGKKFGSLFNTVKHDFNKPVLISEFGCDSYDAYKGEEDQDIQAQFLLSEWEDLYKHSVSSGNKEGICLGGTVFEWNDEWWKHNEGYTLGWKEHNKEAGWSNGSYYFDIKAKRNLNMNEEWFGLVSLSKDKINGINKRIPKKAYYTLKKFLSSLKIRH